MNAKTISKTLSLLTIGFGAITVAACTAPTNEDPPAEETQASQAPLMSSSGGLGEAYTCTDAGFCQCKGLEDCDAMFIICRSLTYCNNDPVGGFRCCCMDYVMVTGGGSSGVVTSPIGSKPVLER